MSDYLPFLVIGVATGAVYALAAMGLVVTYTTSGVFNFAQGAIGVLAAYLFYSLHETAGLPIYVAAAIPVLVVAPLAGALIDRVILARQSGLGSTAAVVVSLGLLVGLQGLVLVIYGAIPPRVDPLFSQSTFRFVGVQISYSNLAVTVISAMVALGLAVFFRRSHLGLQMRAVVNAPELSGLVGTNQRRVTTLSWMLGCALASLAAVLLVDTVGVNAPILILLVVQAFGAAVIGRLTSLPRTFAGAMAIGVVGAMSTKFVAAHPLLAGIPSSLPFIVLFLVLVVSPAGRLREVTADRAASAPVERRTGANPLWLGVPALFVACLLPIWLGPPKMLVATLTLAFVLIFGSLGLLVGLARQLSLCHAVFVGLGAAFTAHLTEHMPFLIALLVAGLILVPIGAIVAIPSIRLSGLFLALATFGFGILVEQLVYNTDFGFSSQLILSVRRPTFFGLSLRGDAAYYFATLLIVLAGVTIIIVLSRSRLGRVLQALADSPTGVESIGITPTTARVAAFCISAFFAALAGGLIAGALQHFSSSNFDYFHSLLWITVLVFVGSNSMTGATIAALLLVALPALLPSRATSSDYQPIIFGSLAIIFAQTRGGVIGLLKHDWSALLARDRWRVDRSPVYARQHEAPPRAAEIPT